MNTGLLSDDSRYAPPTLPYLQVLTVLNDLLHFTWRTVSRRLAMPQIELQHSPEQIQGIQVLSIALAPRIT